MSTVLPGQLALFTPPPRGPQLALFQPQTPPARPVPPRPRRPRRRKTTAAEMSARFGGATHIRLTFAPGILWPWLEKLRPELVSDGSPLPAAPGVCHVHVDHDGAHWPVRGAAR